MQEKDILKSRALERLPDWLFHHFPKGSIKKDTFYIGNLQGEAGSSLRVDLQGARAGLWHDFATNEGGDIFDLWGTLRGIDPKKDFKGVLEDMEATLGDAEIFTPAKTLRKDPHPIVGETPSTCSASVSAQDLSSKETPAVLEWDYEDAAGQVIAKVFRVDEGSQKSYRPFDVLTGQYQAPKVRPLYNLPGILKAGRIILVEGEKCAEALIQKGYPATTAMFGVYAPLAKTDWAPLKGKDVVIWPDQDAPGREYAQRVTDQLLKIGVKSLEILKIPQEKPLKWDAYDALQEGLDLKEFLQTCPRQKIFPLSEDKNAEDPDDLDLGAWTAKRYEGPAPRQEYLVEGVFPIGVVAILAATGDTGKGMMTLDLALKVATHQPSEDHDYNDPPKAFGGEIQTFGTCVIFTAEDDRDEIHRRLERLDPQNLRLLNPERLRVVPLPDAGGPQPWVQSKFDEIFVTKRFERIKAQLKDMDHLKLIILDPLSSFVQADMNADPAMASYTMGLLAHLARETSATVLITHHMRKSTGLRVTKTLEQAREAIRGTSALIDGVRAAYALWSLEEEEREELGHLLGETLPAHVIFKGGVVKANGLASREIRTYKRSSTGLLEDITQLLKEQSQNLPYTRRPSEKPENLEDLLVEAIQEAAREGRPFTHTGIKGLYQRQEELPVSLQSLSRRSLEGLVQDLLDQSPPSLIKRRWRGSKENKYLMSPDGDEETSFDIPF